MVEITASEKKPFAFKLVSCLHAVPNPDRMSHVAGHLFQAALRMPCSCGKRVPLCPRLTLASVAFKLASAMLSHIMICDAVLLHIMVCDVVSLHIMICDAVLLHIMEKI